MTCVYPIKMDMSFSPHRFGAISRSVQYEGVGKADHYVWRPLKLSGTCLTGIDIYCHSSTRIALADVCGLYGAGTAGCRMRRGCNRESTTLHPLKQAPTPLDMFDIPLRNKVLFG